MDATETSRRARIDAALNDAMTDDEFDEFCALTAADDKDNPRP